MASSFSGLEVFDNDTEKDTALCKIIQPLFVQKGTLDQF
jgi:hypothetical protein